MQVLTLRRKAYTHRSFIYPTSLYCRWSSDQDRGVQDEAESVATSFHGFGNLSRRSISSKPIIAAANGSAYGGGTEIILNCDLVIASETAVFALPEVKRGVVAAQGGQMNYKLNRSH